MRSDGAGKRKGVPPCRRRGEESERSRWRERESERERGKRHHHRFPAATATRSCNRFQPRIHHAVDGRAAVHGRCHHHTRTEREDARWWLVTTMLSLLHCSAVACLSCLRRRHGREGRRAAFGFCSAKRERDDDDIVTAKDVVACCRARCPLPPLNSSKLTAGALWGHRS
ncbi:hypothetical protein PIB30_079672 [Stylosanthes scabra]|uniref:Uncharacterized protein n=1 Tax=Stylosanthes scabra TaxID=79078 RepID=A0ABU6XPL3_9FABA|nr:hypothetical protein [Stylosanthes scabra]